MMTESPIAHTAIANLATRCFAAMKTDFIIAPLELFMVSCDRFDRSEKAMLLPHLNMGDA